MIFCVYQSKLSIATLIFYTCFYIPFLQAKHALITILGFIHCVYHFSFECSNPLSTTTDCSKETTCSIELPMGRYGDLRSGESCCRSGGGDGEVCSVCLVEFESEDLVSQLKNCGHVFHVACVERWLEKNQFSCPLCRSLFLNVADGCSHAACSFSCS